MTENERLLRQLLSDDVVDRLRTESTSRALFEGDSTWLKDILRAKATLPLPDVPAIVSQDLRHLFDDALLMQRHQATLVSDSRIDRRLVGVRGDIATSDEWSMTFTCEAADILLDVWVGDTTVDVEGQVMMSHDGETVAFRAQATGPTDRQTATDQLGRFRFENLLTGTYELVLTNQRAEIVVRPDFGPLST